MTRTTNHKENELPVIRKTAKVTVTEPVDGTRRRRRRPQPPAGRNGPVEGFTVHPMVMTAARALLTAQTRLEIVNATTIRVVNR